MHFVTFVHPCVCTCFVCACVCVPIINYSMYCLGVYYSSMDQSKVPIMVIEKMEMSLRDLMERYENVPLNVKLTILDEVCLAIRYLHSRNPPIVHRDLTPNNILLSHCLQAKITDLGVAKIVQVRDNQTMTKVPGTTDFMPPESLADNPVYGLPLDIFSFGGVILYTITQMWPQPVSWVQFDPDNGGRIYLSESQRRQRYLDVMTRDATDVKQLAVSCLNDNPKDRPTAQQVSVAVRRTLEVCSQRSGYFCISPMKWWITVSDIQEPSSVPSHHWQPPPPLPPPPPPPPPLPQQQKVCSVIDFNEYMTGL